MSLRVFNTLSKSKEEFAPIAAGKAGIYVCGITPYDYSHLGHGRCYTAFDVVRRYLGYKGLKVKYVQNFTDIDDKIIKRAAERKIDPLVLSATFCDEYFKDFDRLGVRRADVYPRVTQYIPKIVAFVQRLIGNGYAYAVAGQHGSGNDVYFAVRKFKDYGKLSGQPLENLRAGARVEVDERKQSPEDFALWKSAKPGEPSWDSPWGKGRPGWHIECSVMSTDNLGDTIDIHGGGLDLIFPHHEDEIAQSEATTGKKFAKYWLHNGFVTVGKEKMAKSLGNFITLREALDKYGPRLLRLFYISTHYREPLDSHESRITELRPTLQKLLDLRQVLFEESKNQSRAEKSENDAEVAKSARKFEADFVAAMDDDFNTPLALSALFELKDYAYALSREPSSSRAAFALLLEEYESLANGVLGLFDAQEARAGIGDGEIAALVEQREISKKARDFKSADAIRATLKNHGVILEDTPAGPKWRKAA